jgi:hypothetical protein
MGRHFIKVKEDFVCENCGFRVYGSGYTNHCPKCLFSKHVDEEVPGDRLSDCGGEMKPIGLEKRRSVYKLFHKCTKCGKVIVNKLSETDDFDEVLKIVRKSIDINED